MPRYRVFMSFIVCAVGLGLLLAPTSTAVAAPANTWHSLGTPPGYTKLATDPGFAAAGGGYNGTAAQIDSGGYGWTSARYWAYGTYYTATQRHNCTTYAAFRIQQNGYAYPGWTADASGWATKAWAYGTNVDQTPAVGSVAQWNQGHVAYVEEVAASYIVITEDSYGGGTARAQILRTSPSWPDNFIHFKDCIEGTVTDLVFIKTKNTGSGKVELFSMSATSGFKSFTQTCVSGYNPDYSNNGWWSVADMDGDGARDLVFIKTKNTGSGKVEVHSMSAASGFKTFTHNCVSGFSPDDNDNGWWSVADMDGDGARDLVFIKTKSTGSGKVEVHSMSAASGFKTFTHNCVSGFSPDDNDNGWWSVADMDGDGARDLVFIKTKNTGSGKVEVHSMSAASGFKTFTHNCVSGFGPDDNNNGWWSVADMDGDGARDLVFIKTKNTGSGKVEVHSMSAASGFKTFTHNCVSGFSPADADNGWWSAANPASGTAGRLVPIPPTLYQQTDPKLTYLGAWTPGYTSLASGGSFCSSDGNKATVLVSFKGTSVQLLARKAPWYGKAAVSIDGGSASVVDLYSASTLYKKVVYNKTGLANTAHTMVITRLGQKNTAATGYAVSLDALQVVGTLTQAAKTTAYQQDYAKVRCTGTWTKASSAAASGGTYASANVSGAKITLTFNGSYLAWFAKTAPWYGKAKVTLDGGAPITVDLYSSAETYKKLVYNTGLLAKKAHTLVIQWTGTKRTGSWGTAISADVFGVLGSLQ